MEVKQGELVLCEFYFSDLGSSKKRPVVVFRDNLPFEDFVGIPVSSKVNKLQSDEGLLEPDQLIEGELPKLSKIIVRKTLVISKAVIIKKYGKLTRSAFSGTSLGFLQIF